ncbi:hypothetical protein GGR56DRAFT_618964 [Xylariaceae sp. FL0804]|nr:hypothetical protein GGR56DRAFT_618964 [Xylariaceae sp. FL0804]
MSSHSGRRRRPPAPRHHDREPQPSYPSDQPRTPRVQRHHGGSWSPTRSSHRPAPLSEDLRTRPPMPRPSRPLTRSATVTPTTGRMGRRPRDDEVDCLEERLRSRLASRSTSGSSSRPSQSLSRTGPSGSTSRRRSTPASEGSSGSSTRSSSTDSATSVSTQDHRRSRRVMDKQVEVEPEAPEPVTPRNERRRSHRRHRKSVAYPEESDSESSESEIEEYVHRDEKPSSSHRHRRSVPESRNRSSKRHHHRDRPSEGRTASSAKRSSHRRPYGSDVVHSERPSLARSYTTRSYTTPSSHVTSLPSMSTTSKRSSTLRNFFIQPSHPRHQDKPVKLVSCVVCLDDELPSAKAAKLKCGHRMCRDCLKRSFKLSVKEPQHMPPKCCTSDCIPLKHVDHLFKSEFKKLWNKKFAEFSTRNRIYCPGKRCGEWIKPAQIYRHQNGRKIGKCGSCNIRVCCDCNKEWHNSRRCPIDKETKQILKQAKEEGWQRCFNCRAMVELKEGCNHMTCRCGSEFCMICGVKWKSCDCPWFNFDAVGRDRLDHLPFQEPTLDHGRLAASEGASPGYMRRGQPRNYNEELRHRRRQEQQDEALARRLQYNDEGDDDFLGGLGDIVGIGNTSGHFMNEDYRRGPQNVTVPPIVPPPPPAVPPGPFERANSGTDYLSGVNRARGVRAPSMERLADRFSGQRQGSSPSRRLFAHTLPSPAAPPRMRGPPAPPLPPPGIPLPMMRRHTMEETIYDSSPRSARLGERIVPRRAVPRDYVDDAAVHAPASRRRGLRDRDVGPPKDSVLAGLTGQGHGMNRVYEWRDHVEPVAPDGRAVLSTGVRA